jgi:hypothetical protein
MIVNTGKTYIATRIENNTTPLFGGQLYLALSTDATPPVAGDAVIAGEVTTGGLGRAAATASHTNGQRTWTFSNLFTATGTAPLNIQKVALFDAAVGGNLITEDVIASTVFSQAGDNATFQVVFSL